MLPKELIEDTHPFPFRKGEKFKIFNVTVKIVNYTWASHKEPRNREQILYEVYIEDLRMFAPITQKLLDEHGERV